MSSHYIYLACTTEGCDTRESLYTGDLYSDEFEDSGADSWEGETISIRCKKCQAGVETHELFPGTLAALDKLTIRPEATRAREHRCEFYPHRDVMQCVCGNREVTS